MLAHARYHTSNGNSSGNGSRSSNNGSSNGNVRNNVRFEGIYEGNNTPIEVTEDEEEGCYNGLPFRVNYISRTTHTTHSTHTAHSTHSPEQSTTQLFRSPPKAHSTQPPP
jgi:hypothetical protein